METTALKPFQQRVIDEHAELSDKLDKLIAFIGTQTYLDLPAPERDRLWRQSIAMGEYLSILAQRIAAFKLDNVRK